LSTLSDYALGPSW